MRVRVIAFGILKDWVSPVEPHVTEIDLPDGATVGALLDRLRAMLPAHAPKDAFRGIAVGVNAEYAQAAHILHDGDEVGLLPPVSGGAPRAIWGANDSSPRGAAE
ncbi:MAG TPA: MoaD/ThiS family protein [Candidatus Sulfotelmatobacter sp.]